MNEKDELTIRRLKTGDTRVISSAFTEIGWDKPASQYERYYKEQEAGDRWVMVAYNEGVFAGYLTIVWASDYPYFRENNIPEIVDLVVLPVYQRRGIASRLMDEAEKVVFQLTATIGIGVGLCQEYGAAQIMYVKRGYIPDGKGVHYGEKIVSKGEPTVIDDCLNLFFTKKRGVNI